jgi:hypothetical protein
MRGGGQHNGKKDEADNARQAGEGKRDKEGDDTTRGGGRRTQRKAIRRQMTQREGGTNNAGG